VCSFFFSSRRRHTRSKRDWSSDVCSSDLHALPQNIEKLFVGLCLLQYPEESFSEVRRISKQVPQLPEYIEFFFIKQKLFLSCAGAPDIDRRIDAAFAQVPIQMELHVAGPFEFLIDHVIHAASGIH